MTDRYAVIGYPVAHSQSPEIHAQFARAVGHDIDYVRILGTVGGFADDVLRFRATGGRGMNVTVPFKLDAFALATECTARAAHARAVNTLEFDGPLLDQHPACIAIANRTPMTALELAAQFATLGAGRVRAGGAGAFEGEAFDIVINATSASLVDQVPTLTRDVFAGDALAYDMVYGKASLPFLAYATSQGAARAMDGLGMLVEQAAESFFLWRGVRPPAANVLRALRHPSGDGGNGVRETIEAIR